MCVTDAKTLLFPCFDGNGMWLSMGNIAAHDKIGMLFINMVEPHRVRVQGTARLIRDPEKLQQWQDVGSAVEVTITHCWINCPRYIHPMHKGQQSSHVPSAHRPTQPADWKSLEVVADVIPPEPHTLAQQNHQKTAPPVLTCQSPLLGHIDNPIEYRKTNLNKSTQSSCVSRQNIENAPRPRVSSTGASR